MRSSYDFEWLQISLEVVECQYPFRSAWDRKKTFWNHLIKCFMLTIEVMVNAIKRNLLNLFRTLKLVYLRWKLQLIFVFPWAASLPLKLRLPGNCNIQTKMGFAHHYIFTILLDLGCALYHPFLNNALAIYKDNAKQQYKRRLFLIEKEKFHLTTWLCWQQGVRQCYRRKVYTLKV